MNLFWTFVLSLYTVIFANLDNQAKVPKRETKRYQHESPPIPKSILERGYPFCGNQECIYCYPALDKGQTCKNVFQFIALDNCE